MDTAHDECEFCQGRQARRDGWPSSVNPFPYPPPTLSDLDRFDDPHVLWDLGWNIGGPETDRLIAEALRDTRNGSA